MPRSGITGVINLSVKAFDLIGRVCKFVACAFIIGVIGTLSSASAWADQWEMTPICDVAVTTPSIQQDEEWFMVEGDLRGQGQGWLGIQAVATRGMPEWDTLELNLQAVGNSRILNITMTEQDGSRWSAATGISTETRSIRLHPQHFRWLSGPDSRKTTRMQPGELKNLELWVKNTFQGTNGIRLQEPVLSDRIRSVKSVIASSQTLPLQEDTTLTLQLKMGDRRPESPRLWLATSGTCMIRHPEYVDVTSETVHVPLFTRESGDDVLYLYDPVHDVETSTPIHVGANDLFIRYGIEGFDGQQVATANQAVIPWLQLEGGSSVPLTVHVEVTDNRGQKVVSEFQAVPEILSKAGRFKVPRAGLYEVRVRAYAEGMNEISHQWETNPVALVHAEPVYEPVPDNITTTALLGVQITLESAPTTATLLGEDRYELFVVGPLPRERILNRWPFGINSGQFMRLSGRDIDTVGVRRLEWHKKLGSAWGGSELWWESIAKSPGNLQWSLGNKIIRTYRRHSVKLSLTLGFNSLWNPEISPATDEERGHWFSFVRKLEQNYDGLIWGLEVWDEPDTDRWKPEPDAKAYRQLVKTTWDAARTSGTETISGPRIVAGATSEFDPMFLGSLFEEGYEQFFDALSFHFNPADRSGSPEQNAFGESILEALKFLSGSKIVQTRNPNDPMQVWLTEMAYPTGPYGVTRKLQANFLVRLHTMGLYHNVGKLFWSRLVDEERKPWNGTDLSSHSGLLDFNYQFKPSAVAYNMATFWMGSMIPLEYRKVGNAHLYSFEVVKQSLKWPGKMHITWTDDPETTENILIPHDSGGQMFAVDYLGASLDPIRMVMEDDDSSAPRQLYEYRSGYDPVYIWDAGEAPRL